MKKPTISGFVGAAHTRQGAISLHPAASMTNSFRFAEKQRRTGVWGLQAPAGTGGARFLLLATVFAAILSGPALADETTETRLRDALRQAITQQRSLEDSQAQLQAKVSDQDKLIQALQAQLEQKVSPQAQPAPAGQPDQAVIQRIEAEANRRLAAQNETAARLGETLEKWKSAYEQAANVARAKEAERLKLASQVDGLVKRSDACVAKNAALFKAGNEILDHLKNISVAEAMAAHEPFVGVKKVELQNLAQDDQDKLLDQVAPPQGVAPVAQGVTP